MLDRRSALRLNLAPSVRAFRTWRQSRSIPLQLLVASGSSLANDADEVQLDNRLLASSAPGSFDTPLQKMACFDLELLAAVEPAAASASSAAAEEVESSAVACPQTAAADGDTPSAGVALQPLVVVAAAFGIVAALQMIVSGCWEKVTGLSFPCFGFP